MKRNILLSVLLFGVMLLRAEPSVYEPQRDTGIKRVIMDLKRELAIQKERIDGLTTVVEGLSATLNELQQHNEISQQSSSSEQTAALLKELGAMIDHINATYVSKTELQEILEGSKRDPISPNQAKKRVSIQSPPKQKSHLEKKGASELYIEGVRLFQKKRYDEAKKRFEITDIKGYKPAASNYYLGEIAYYTRHYNDAIFYFKKSAGIYDRAGYIDTLLLHTAISLEKTGDKEQAKRFYENIVANYQGRKTAEIAKRKLKRL